MPRANIGGIVTSQMFNRVIQDLLRVSAGSP
jgi:hypothetical protein